MLKSHMEMFAEQFTQTGIIQNPVGELVQPLNRNGDLSARVHPFNATLLLLC